jgi:hypothetical protein
LPPCPTRLPPVIHLTFHGLNPRYLNVFLSLLLFSLSSNNLKTFAQIQSGWKLLLLLLLAGPAALHHTGLSKTY